MRIDVFTIFPGLLDAWLEVGVLGRGRRQGLLETRVWDLRRGATDVRRSVDDSPFGGGAGMVLAPTPVFSCVESADAPRPLYLLSAAGVPFDQRFAARLAATGGFSLLCGRYEGVDERIAQHLADEEISIGDFILSGGEVAAVAVIEAVARLLPGVLGNDESPADESFTSDLLEYPQYTRPASFRGWRVPEVLLSGDHGKIRRWRAAEALKRTIERRPDLLERRGGLREDEVRLLEEHGYSSKAAGRFGSAPACEEPVER